MSAPSRRICPALGRSAPVTRLTKVVLPAPFGPINACRAPCSSRNSTALATVSAPKLLCSPRVSSAGALIAPPASSSHRAARLQPLEEPEHSAAGEEHEEHHEQPNPEIPINRVDRGETVLRDHVERDADERAIKPPDPADDQHDEDRAGTVEAKKAEGDELRRLRDQRARHPGQCRRNRVDDETAAGDRRADRMHTQDILTNPDE